MLQAQDIGQIEFPLTLVNTLSDIQSNVTSHFTTRFDNPLKLPGEWEMGLTSVSFTNSINNIPYIEDGGIEISVELTENGTQITGGVITSLEVGNYRSIEILISSILGAGKNIRLDNNKTVNLHTLINMEYNGITNKIRLFTTNSAVNSLSKLQITFSKQICSMIGLDNPIVTINNTPFSCVFPRSVDINAGVYLMYIMCDHMEYSYVGNTTAPILRIIPIAAEIRHTGYVTLSFEDIQWRKLTQNFISDITIKAHEDLHGNRIKFSHGVGPLVLNLKLRKIR